VWLAGIRNRPAFPKKGKQISELSSAVAKAAASRRVDRRQLDQKPFVTSASLPRWNAVLQGTLYGIGKSQEKPMLKKSLIIAGALLFASSAFAQSGPTPGASNSAPGQQMHDAKKSTAPGASEYAPGQKMQDAKKSTAPGASEYAPGHQTTTGSSGAMKK
jgi:hypothetical protein